MPTQLPADPVLMETTIAEKIKSVFLSVPVIANTIQNVYSTEQFPDSEDEDIDVSTVADPVIGARKRLTSIITVGVPKINEFEYTSDECTQLNLVYPIYFNFSVVDFWDTSAGFEFSNSSSLVKAVYLRARRAFKFDRDLGFVNCVHNYLQQDSSILVVDDEETGSLLHINEWRLEVQCTGVLV